MSGNFVVSQTTPCSLLPHLWPFYMTCRHPTSCLDCIRYIYHVHTIWEGVTRPGNPASALLIPCPMLTLIYPSPLLQLCSCHIGILPTILHLHTWPTDDFGLLEPLDSLWLPLISPFLPHHLPSLFLRPGPSGGWTYACNHVPWCTYYPSMAKYDLFDRSFIQ